MIQAQGEAALYYHLSSGLAQGLQLHWQSGWSRGVVMTMMMTYAVVRSFPSPVLG